MGVQGLTSLLQKNSRPQVVSLSTQQAASWKNNVLLVDASAVGYYLIAKLGRQSVDWKSTTCHAALYEQACSFYQGIQNCGLRCVLIMDGACAPMHESTSVERTTQRVQDPDSCIPPTFHMVMMQVYLDLGLEVERSVHCADKLLLAWYRRNSASVFAVLTNDSDFYVYGVSNIVHVEDVVIDRGSVTLHVWNTTDAWSKWLQACARRGARGSMHISLMQRAQVAAILGNDSSKDLRKRLSARAKQQREGSAAQRFSLRPNIAAQEILVRGGDRLDLSFFRSEPLSLKSFDEEDLQAFNAVVQEYMQDDEEARSGAALDKLRISSETLPWLQPHLVQRLAHDVASALLTVFATRGFRCQPVPGPHWSALQGIRRAAAAALGAPAAVYEYDANTKILYRLTPEQPISEAATRAQWFVPAVHLPGVRIVDASAPQPSDLPCPPDSSLQQIVAAIQAADPELPPSLVVHHALLLAALQPTEREAYRSAVRQLLLPDVPMPQELLAAAAANGGEAAEAAAELEELALAEDGLIDVGSSLSKADWDDIDAKEVVAKVRSSTGFTLMTKIQPWDPLAVSAAASQDLPADKLFHLFYLLSQQDGIAAKLWDKLLKRCFSRQLEEAFKGDKSAVKARRKELLSVSEEALLQELRSTMVVAALWVSRLQAFVKSRSAPALLAVRRDAAVAGPEAVQWPAAQECWSESNLDVKRQALVEMWSNRNSAALNYGGPPMRYPHQQELLDMVGSHLTELQKAMDAQDAARRQRKPQEKLPEPLPLHVILSTPTGSGKTFTAVMMHLHLLRPRTDPKLMTGSGDEGHPEAIILYSVPTKQVLKRVGQECEAHGVVYWTAAKEGDMHQVRRPYSVRTKRGDTRGGSGSGPMRDQLEKTEAQARANSDLGGGTPSFIVADIDSTAAILKVAANASPDDWYHSSKLVLYFDEPNMGIHLSASLRAVVREIMRFAPYTAILASATLPSWDQLPAWWKGRGLPATRTVVTQEPYNLPMSKLEVLSESTGTVTPVSVLQLFQSYNEFSQRLSQSQRLQVLLLRHLHARHANQLLLGSAKWDDASNVEEEGWVVAGQDVRSLREAVQPELLSLDAEGFSQLHKQWAEPSRRVEDGLRAVISQKGVTMIATRNAPALALEVAGKFRDEEKWAEAVREMRAKVSAAVQAQRLQAKDQRRTQKKDQDEGPAASTEQASIVVTLRTGLWVSIQEAQETHEDVLVMLSKGVAYACAAGQEPLVKRLYQQALLYIPESKVLLPPIHVLVVDYSAIYGTDCAAVDTIVMREDLGHRLSWEDHQQFIGRLRRDGTAIYPSLAMLRYATTGVRSDASDDEVIMIKANRLEQLQMVSEMLRGYGEQQGADATASVSEELAALRKSKLDKLSRSDIACCVLTTALRSLLESPAGVAAAAAGKAALFKAAVGRLSKWGTIKPASLLTAPTPAEQVNLVYALEKLCFQVASVPEAAAGAGEEVAAAAAAAAPAASTTPGGPYMLVAMNLLKWLYDEDILTEDGVMAWVKASQGPAAPSAFAKAVQPFIDWLQEASSGSEEEDEED